MILTEELPDCDTLRVLEKYLCIKTKMIDLKTNNGRESRKMLTRIMHKNVTNSAFTVLSGGSKNYSILDNIQLSGGSYEKHSEHEHSSFMSGANSISPEKQNSIFMNYTAFVREFEKLKARVYGA